MNDQTLVVMIQFYVLCRFFVKGVIAKGNVRGINTAFSILGIKI